jgi:hypothetical protein
MERNASVIIEGRGRDAGGEGWYGMGWEGDRCDDGVLCWARSDDDV